MDDVKSLLELPTSTLIPIAMGYVGYKISYIGRDTSLKTVDIILICAVFGFISRIAFEFSIAQEFKVWVQYFAALVSVVSASIVWRKWLSKYSIRLLRAGNVSNSDGQITAWETLRLATDDRVIQLVVRKNNGSALMCSNLKNFVDDPHGPALLGADGSIVLYADKFRSSPDQDWEDRDAVRNNWGAAVTYVPAAQVNEVELRYLP